MGAGWIIGGLAVAGGLGFYFYEKGKATAPAAVQTPANTSVDQACANAAKFVALRKALPNQSPNVLYPAYKTWADACIAAGGTPPAWPG